MVVVLPSLRVVPCKALVGASVVDEDVELVVEELDEVTELLSSKDGNQHTRRAHEGQEAYLASWRRVLQMRPGWQRRRQGARRVAS
jgi:hypothetical protein